MPQSPIQGLVATRRLEGCPNIVSKRTVRMYLSAARVRGSSHRQISETPSSRNSFLPGPPKYPTEWPLSQISQTTGSKCHCLRFFGDPGPETQPSQVHGPFLPSQVLSKGKVLAAFISVCAVIIMALAGASWRQNRSPEGPKPQI